MKNSLNIYSLLFLTTNLLSLLLGGCTQKNEPAQAEKPEPALYGQSIYQSIGEWHNQNGDTLQLSKFNGKIPIVAMVFTRCKFACTRIIEDLKSIEKQVPLDKKDKVLFVLVSFDSERDHPARLKEFAEEMKLEESWVLLHGNEEDIRELSMLLNVKYKKQPNGDFAHSNGITLLNTQGAIAAQIEGLGVSAQPILDKMKHL